MSEEFEAEARADDCRELHDPLAIWRQALQALLHGVQDRNRDRQRGDVLRPPPGAVSVGEVATLYQRAQYLFNEEGIALAALLQRRPELRRWRPLEAKRGADDGTGLLEGESVETDLLGKTPARQLGEEVVEGVAPMQLVAAVCTQEEYRVVAQLACEVGKELERCFVCPVQVLHGDDDRTTLCEVSNKMREGRMHPVALGLARDLESHVAPLLRE